MYEIDRERIVWETMDSETVLFDLVSGFYYSLDEIGTFIWEKLCIGQDEDDIVKGIVEEYNVDESVCRADVQELLRELKEADLVGKDRKPSLEN